MAIETLLTDTATTLKILWIAHKVGEAGFVPFHCITSLKISAEQVAQESVDNLRDVGYSPSAKLCRSLKVGGPARNGNWVQMQVLALDYYKYVSKGIKGTRGGRTVGGFVFNNDIPSRQMVTSIAAWLKRSNKVSVQQVKRYHIRSSARKRPTLDNMHTAYLIARSIKQKGIKPNYFFDMAVAHNKLSTRERLRKAFVADIFNSLAKI